MTKYAQASSVKVTVEQENGYALVEVADDGVGGADPLRGSGLSGLADRVASLSGKLCCRQPARAREPVSVPRSHWSRLTCRISRMEQSHLSSPMSKARRSSSSVWATATPRCSTTTVDSSRRRWRAGADTSSTTAATSSSSSSRTPPRSRGGRGAQRAFAAHAWPEGVDLRVRMGMHTGEPTLRDDGVLRARRPSRGAHRAGRQRRASAALATDSRSLDAISRARRSRRARAAGPRPSPSGSSSSTSPACRSSFRRSARHERGFAVCA